MAITTEEFIQLLKNDDVKALNKIYLKFHWKEKIDFSEVYNVVCNLDNSSTYDILGNMYCSGIGVDQNHEKGIEYFHKAADKGNLNAQNELGYIYRYGKGVEKDYEKALEYYQKAADQDNALSLNNLGYMYQYGKGVEKDYEKALEYYQKAADLGCESAKDNLGIIFNEDNDMIIFVLNIIKEKNKLIQKVKELEEEVIDLKYKPGGSGYEEARREFEKLSS